MHRPLLIAIAGLLVACPLRGHFAKPHIDFFDFNDAADALLSSPLESSHKRGPVYPALLAIGGGIARACGVVDPPPRQFFAEWLNALLLPLNGVLVYLLARAWLPADHRAAGVAQWTAAAYLILPLSLSMTAHLLVEPLLTTMLLLTILAANAKRRALAYALASAAMLTRYDVAGLWLGLVVADILARRIREALIGGIAAILPLAIWLGLTAMRWSRELDQHYLHQIADRPQFDLLWSLRVTLDACFAPSRVSLPAWIDLDESWIRFSVRSGLAVFACIGIWSLARMRDRSSHAALGGAIGYVLIHAVFPFQWDRFGYPMAPLLLASAGAGAVRLRQLCASDDNRLLPHPIVRHGLVATALLFTAALSIAMLQAIADVHVSGRAGWFRGLLLCLALPFGTFIAVSALQKRWALTIFGVLFLCWLVPLQLREGCAELGSGQEREGLVRAARWIAANTGPREVILTDQDGLLRLHAPRLRDQIIAFWQIESDNWPEIVAECRRRGVSRIMWHSAINDDHAHGMYVGWWRVSRFAPLEARLPPAELIVAHCVVGEPTVTIFEFAE